MKHASFQRILLLTAFLTITGCATMYSRWDDAREANTIQSYEEFLKQYPQEWLAYYAQKRIEILRSDASPEVKEELRKIYFNHTHPYGPSTIAESVYKLGEMGEKALPAVPFLIELLSDSRPVTVGQQRFISGQQEIIVGEPSFSPSEWDYGLMLFSWRTSPGKETEKALKKITGQDFGTDLTEWQKWWKKNKAK